MMEDSMAEKLGPAFAVSRVGTATKYGGTTYTIKAHFHTRDHAETVRRLLEEQPLPPGPFPEQYATQAESIDLDKLRAACVWYGYAPPSQELLGWWVGREVNRLLGLILQAKDATQGAHPPGVKVAHLKVSGPSPTDGSAKDNQALRTLSRLSDEMGEEL